MLKPNELDVCAALPIDIKRQKLSVRALTLLTMLECQLKVCASLPPEINARAILCLLAGSLSLNPTLHTSFAKAGYVASRAQIKGQK